MTGGTTPEVGRRQVETPVGRLLLVARDGRIVKVTWQEEELAPEDGQGELLDEATRQLDAYFGGRLTDFELPLAPAGSDFQKAVWREMCRIPYGGVLTYGEMAKRAGGVARAVGGACGANPIPVIIPCHRVVAGGNLGGYSGAGGLETKTALLRLEGALPPELPLF